MVRMVPCCGVAAFVAGAVVIIIRKKAQHSEPDLGPVPGPPAAVEKNYGDALKIAMQFFDVQRSGKLVNNKISCRGDSALKDGSKAKLDLSKGMYEVGDHMKFGFPKAFTATVLSWAILKYGDQMQTVNLLKPAQDSLKWITDYLVNAHPSENVLYIQVGDSEADHKCWDRPETMTEKRPLTQVNTSSPGTEVAAETAAAMASASLACYGDELLWAASWLHHVTGDQSYFDYVTGKNGKAFAKWGSPTWFSWENKLAGSQVLLSRISFFFVPKTHPTQKTSRSTGKLPRLSCVGSCQNLQQPTSSRTDSLMKLNVDGSAKGSPGPAGYGGLLRNDQGAWVAGFVGSIGVATSLDAEIWRILEGLLFIKAHNLRGVIVESNSAYVISLMKPSSLNGHKYKAMIEDCKAIANEQECSFKHTLRQENFCADFLANLGASITDDFVILENPPSGIGPLLQENLVGTAFIRPA